MLGVAVVGAGHWGPNLIRNLHEGQRSDVRLVVDRDPGRREAIARRYQIATAAEPEAAYGDPRMDAVVVATPTESHYDIARDALRAGKHVLVEKPMTADVAQAQALCEEARQAAGVLMVGHVFLFNPAVLYVADLLHKERLGRVLHISAQRTNLGPIRTDVDAGWDLASHDISIVDLWLGACALSVSACGGSWINPGIADAVFATLRYPDGVLFNVHVSWLAPNKVRQLVVVCERGMITFDDLSPTEPIRIYDKGVASEQRDGGIIDTYGAFRTSLRQGDIVIPRVPGGEPLRAECDAFVAAAGGAAVPAGCDAQGGLDVVRALAAMSRSMAARGREEAL